MPHLPRRDLRPVAGLQPVGGVGTPLAHPLEDHGATISTPRSHALRRSRWLGFAHDADSRAAGRAGPDRRGRGTRLRLRGHGAGARRPDAQRHRPLRRAASGSRSACSTATASSPARPAPARPRPCSSSPSSSAPTACRSSRPTSRATCPASASRARAARRSRPAPTSVGQEWTATGFPTEFYALGGQGIGVPLRVTMTSFGPMLLSKVLGLNDTQESSLGLVFHYADQAGPAAARPRRPARGRAVPDQRRGQGRPQGARRPLERDRRRDPARADLLPGPGRRRVLR